MTSVVSSALTNVETGILLDIELTPSLTLVAVVGTVLQMHPQARSNVKSIPSPKPQIELLEELPVEDDGPGASQVGDTHGFQTGATEDSRDPYAVALDFDRFDLGEMSAACEPLAVPSLDIFSPAKLSEPEHRRTELDDGVFGEVGYTSFEIPLFEGLQVILDRRASLAIRHRFRFRFRFHSYPTNSFTTEGSFDTRLTPCATTGSPSNPSS